jgi:SNF2 family DNA or RNA helicase
MSSFGKILRINPPRPAAYQLIPLLKILKNGHNGVLVCDGVGVGKTISAGYIIAYLSVLLDRPSVVVAPPSLVEKWLIEMQVRFGFKAFTITSTDEFVTAVSEMKHPGQHHRSRVYIMSNTILRKSEIVDLPESAAIIFDEIHNYRNKETHLHRGAVEIAQKTNFRIGLSATPINNSLEDLTSELRIIMPRYEWDTVDVVVQDIWSSDRTNLTHPLLTRFVKEKLGIHFASRSVKNIHISYPNEYYTWVRESISRERKKWVESYGTFETITLFRLASSSLRAFTHTIGENPPMEISDSKLDALRTYLASVKSTHIIIFCEFKETVKLLEEAIEDWPVYSMTGDTPVFDRVDAINEFRASDNGLFILTSVGSEGLDLQFSDTVVNYDLHWNPMKIEQRVGRIDRIGQEKDIINVANIIVEGSIDERIISVLKRKLEIVSGSVLDTSPILETVNRDLLFDEEVYNQEVSRGKRLIEALEWTNRIPQDDYDILSSVDTSYCDLFKLRENALNHQPIDDLIIKTELSNKYLNNLQSTASELRDLLRYYS